MKERFAAFALAASVATSNEACVPKYNEPDILQLTNEMNPETVSDPHNIREQLRENEYIVPDWILNIYAAAIDPTIREQYQQNPSNVTAVQGGYTHRNYINTPDERIFFCTELEKHNIPEETISDLLRLFTQHDVIFIKESSLENPTITEILRHERYHQAEHQQLSREEQNTLHQAAEALQRLLPQWNEEYWVHWENRDPNSTELPPSIFRNHRNQMQLLSITSNTREVFAYYTQGVFTDEIEERIDTMFPEAVEIANRIYTGTALSE